MENHKVTKSLAILLVSLLAMVAGCGAEAEQEKKPGVLSASRAAASPTTCPKDDLGCCGDPCCLNTAQCRILGEECFAGCFDHQDCKEHCMGAVMRCYDKCKDNQ